MLKLRFRFVSDRDDRVGKHQNHPNPLSRLTMINFELPGPAQASLTIYNVSSRLVRVLLSQSPGS